MTDSTQTDTRRNRGWWGLGMAALALVLIWPGPVAETLVFCLTSLRQIAPLVVPGIVLAAWIVASGADAHVAQLFEGRLGPAIVMAAAVGAVTPVCGVTVLPLMTALLAAGVPLAPVMAFWLSSPVTDPAMLATTAATLGVGFAVGKTLAAFGLGLGGGAVTVLCAQAAWYRTPLRDNRIVAQVMAARCGRGAAMPLKGAVWQEAARRALFARQAWATTRLMLICLIPAFAAEYWLNELLSPQALSAWLGAGQWYAIPLAVTVGAPAYVDGYAALPLTRGMMAAGMSPGAAMGFLVSGGVVSIWGAMAIFPVLRLRPFLLYLMLAVSGSLVAAYVFEWVV